MPRKKITNDPPATEETTAAAPPENEAKPKRTSRRKKAEEPAPPSAETTAPAPVEEQKGEPKKPSRSRKRAVEAPQVEEPPQPQPAAEEKPEAPKRQRRGRKEKPEPEPAVSAAAEPAASLDAEPVAEARVRGRSRRKKAEQKAPEPTPVDGLEEAADDDLPVPIWRPRQKLPEVAAAAPGTDRTERAEGDSGPTAPRRSRNRRRKDQRDTEINAEVAPKVEEEKPERTRPERTRRGQEAKREQPQEAPAEKPKPVAPPSRPRIPVPDDAPQVVLRGNLPVLVRNHRVYPPIAFFGSSPDEQRAATVLEQMRLVGDAGIHLYSHLIEFEVDPQSVDGAVSFAAYLLKKTLEIDPDAQVIFRIIFVAPAGWQDRFPEARYMTADGGLAEPSVCDDRFWKEAEQCLQTFIRRLRLLPNKDGILGLHLERGEWFYAQGWGYDTSPAARSKFRKWARVRYADDVVALRAAWFDGSVNFDGVSIPAYEGEGDSAEKFVRASRRERRWVDYHLFLSDATVERIGDLAYAAKEASEGYFLVGASYGYTFEWSHPASGHLSLGKLLRTHEIDFIAGPPSYRTREPGGAAPFPGPIDSFALNGKLYISEEDFKTSIGGRQEPDDFNPIIKTPQALESVHWRGAGAALAHGSGVCWMDLWGNGWLKTPSIWDRAKAVQDALIRRMECPLSEPDVAVFIDERALAYLVDEKAFALLVQNVRESIMRSGLSAGFYLLSDLQHREQFPESKLYVFLNAWDIRPELRAAIKTRLQRDNKVLFWLYAAGLFDSGRESLERAREVTGIALKPQPFHSKAGTTILNRRHALCDAFPERTIVSGSKLEPSYFAIPEEATVLGEYSQTGLPSFVIREFKHEHDHSLDWTSVFLGEPVVTPALLRSLGQIAGAHIWNYQEDVVHVRAPFLTVHCTGSGARAVALPRDWEVYSLNSAQWQNTEAGSLRFHGLDGSTHNFLVGLRHEIETVLNADPAVLLFMEQLPPKPENTLSGDAAAFDVPIMKLGEWMEGAEGDDIADDFLFKAALVEESEPESEDSRPGRRRKRRGRGSRDREGSEETASPRRDGEAAVVDPDLGLNVMFRKRE